MDLGLVGYDLGGVNLGFVHVRCGTLWTHHIMSLLRKGATWK